MCWTNDTKHYTQFQIIKNIHLGMQLCAARQKSVFVYVPRLVSDSKGEQDQTQKSCISM